jgi:hypothetical protein
MKSYSKRRRMLRRLAVAGCLAALAVPASASAMQQNPNAQPAGTQQSHYTLPASFRPEVQTPAAQQSQSRSLNIRPEVQTPVPQSSAPTTSVIRQVETVNHYDGRTLAIVLAAVALGVALCTLGFGLVRITQLQRRALGSR